MKCLAAEDEYEIGVGNVAGVDRYVAHRIRKPSHVVPAAREKLLENVKSFKKAPPDVTGKLLLSQLEIGGGKVTHLHTHTPIHTHTDTHTRNRWEKQAGRGGGNKASAKKKLNQLNFFILDRCRGCAGIVKEIKEMLHRSDLLDGKFNVKDQIKSLNSNFNLKP